MKMLLGSETNLNGAEPSGSEPPVEDTDPMFQLVRAQLLALDGVAVDAATICSVTELLGLGLDSLTFVDLTVALEDALQLDRFPMQEWVDELVESDRALTVGALVHKCRELVRVSRA